MISGRYCNCHTILLYCPGFRLHMGHLIRSAFAIRAEYRLVFCISMWHDLYALVLKTCVRHAVKSPSTTAVRLCTGAGGSPITCIIVNVTRLQLVPNTIKPGRRGMNELNVSVSAQVKTSGTAMVPQKRRYPWVAFNLHTVSRNLKQARYAH